MHDAHDRYMLHITQLFLLPAAQCVGTLVTQTARCAPECGHQLTSDHWDHSDHGDISVEPCPHPAPGKLQDQADIALLTSSIPTNIHLQFYMLQLLQWWRCVRPSDARQSWRPWLHSGTCSPSCKPSPRAGPSPHQKTLTGSSVRSGDHVRSLEWIINLNYSFSDSYIFPCAFTRGSNYYVRPNFVR